MSNALAQKDDRRGSLLPATLAGNPVAVVLDQFDPAHYNFVTPVTAVDHLPAMTRIAIQVVRVNPATETYPIPGSSERGVGKTALNRLSAAAGISWTPERSGQVDRYNDPHRVRYRAVGEILDFSGVRRTLYGEKEIDLRGTPDDPDSWGRDTAEIVRVAEKAREKGRDPRDPWNQVYQARQHIHSLAETKAKLRAIRETLSLKAAMPPAEIAKPWVVPHLVPDLDCSDPEVKRIVVAHTLGAAAALYGPTPVATLSAGPVVYPEPESAPLDPEDAPVIPNDQQEAEGWLEVESATADPDPWDIPGAADLPCLLPAALDQVTDPTRRRYIERLNQLAARLPEVEVVRLAAGVDPYQHPLADLATLGRALADAVAAGGAS